MKKKTPILLFSLALGLLPLSVSGLTSCETKKAVYSINLNQVVGATLSADKIEASEGELITLTISSLQVGKEVDKVIISDDIEVSKVNDSTYTFVMPNKEVDVSLVLKDIVYSISVTDVTGVTLDVPASSIGGQEIEINVLSIPTGKHISGFKGVTTEKKETNKYVFVMPFENVTITPLLEDTIYTISVGETDGATLSLSKETAVYNETITINVTNLPKGKQVKAITVSDNVNVQTVNETTYQFVMPASNVTISATLEYAYVSGTISYANEANYHVSISNTELGEVETTPTVTGLAFSLIKDYEYTISITNYDKEMYIPSLILNGSSLELINDRANFVANASLLTFSIVDNVIEYNLNYNSEDVNVLNNVTKSTKGSLIKFKPIEKDGFNYGSYLVYSGEKDTSTYEEIAVTETNEDEYPYSFTMPAKPVHIEINYDIKKVELNFAENSTSFKGVVKSSYYLVNGVLGDSKYLNSNNSDIDYGTTLRIFLNDIIVTDRDGNNHVKYSLSGIKFNNTDVTLIETSEHDAKYYCDITLTEDINIIEIIGSEQAFIKNTISLDNDGAVNVDIFTDESLSEESKTENYYAKKNHYVRVTAIEGYEVVSVKFTYYKWAYSYGSYSKQLVTITPKVNGNVYSFDTNSMYFENYCEILCTIKTKRIMNYAGKSFVGTWFGRNVFNSNIHDTNLQSSNNNYTVYIEENGTIKKNTTQICVAEYLDEENHILKENESTTDYKKIFSYGNKTLIGNDSPINKYDRIFGIKQEEGTTASDYKSIAYTFGDTGRDYSIIQWFKKNSEGEFIPYAGAFTNNIDNIVYNDVTFDFISGESLLSSGTKLFNVIDESSNTVATISADDSSAKLVSEEDLIERTISTSSVTGCTITPSKTTAYAGENITLTVSNLDEGKVIDKVFANDVECNKNSDGTYSFVVPTSDVEITVTYKVISNITVTESEEATITVDKTSAASGEIVTISVSNIIDGKAVGDITVSGLNGSVVVRGTNGTYEFTMPSEDVTVTVTFVDYVAPEVPFANKSYEGSRTTSDYDPEWDEYLSIIDTLKLAFSEDGSKVNVYLTKNYNRSETTEQILDLPYNYTEPSGEATTGTITIELNSSTLITLIYDPTADTFRIGNDVTYNGTTYYLGPTTLSLIA